MLKAPDVLRSIQKVPFAASHPVDEFGHPRPDCIESVSAPPIAEHPWPNHGGGQRWRLIRSPLRQTVPPAAAQGADYNNDEGHATDAPMGASAVKCWRPPRNLFAC